MIRTALDRNLPENITIVIDRGMVTLENLCCMRELKVRFIVGIPNTIKEAGRILERTVPGFQSLKYSFNVPTSHGQKEM